MAGVLPNRPEPTPPAEVTPSPVEKPERTHEESMAVFHKILNESTDTPIEPSPPSPPSSPNQAESMAKYHRIVNEYERKIDAQKQILPSFPTPTPYEQPQTPTKAESKNIFKKITGWFSRPG